MNGTSLQGNDVDIETNLEKHILGSEEGDQEPGKTSRDRFSSKITFLTRALVKNNVVTQNMYLALITLEYLFKVYFVLRIVDYESMSKGFKLLEEFLNVEQANGVSWNTV